MRTLRLFFLYLFLCACQFSQAPQITMPTEGYMLHPSITPRHRETEIPQLVASPTPTETVGPTLTLTPYATATDAPAQMTASRLIDQAYLFLVTPNPPEALRLIDQAMTLEPDVAVYHVLRAEALFYYGDNTAARAELEIAIALDPELGSAYELMLMVLLAGEGYEAVLAYYPQALEAVCNENIIHTIVTIARMQGDITTADSVQEHGCEEVAP